MIKIEYKKGEMVLTHPSGHVDRYQRTDLEMQRVNIQEQIADLQKSRTGIVNRITLIQESVGAQ